MTTEITTIQHPTSGETYAVEITDNIIVRAAGPLRHADSCEHDDLVGWLDNSFDAKEDGAWLNGELGLTEQAATAYEIVTLDEAGQWVSDQVGDPNVFDTRAEAEAGIIELRKLGEDWAEAEYDVREIEN